MAVLSRWTEDASGTTLAADTSSPRSPFSPEEPTTPIATAKAPITKMQDVTWCRERRLRARMRARSSTSVEGGHGGSATAASIISSSRDIGDLLLQSGKRRLSDLAETAVGVVQGTGDVSSADAEDRRDLHLRQIGDVAEDDDLALSRRELGHLLPYLARGGWDIRR